MFNSYQLTPASKRELYILCFEAVYILYIFINSSSIIPYNGMTIITIISITVPLMNVLRSDFKTCRLIRTKIRANTLR